MSILSKALISTVYNLWTIYGRNGQAVERTGSPGLKTNRLLTVLMCRVQLQCHEDILPAHDYGSAIWNYRLAPVPTFIRLDSWPLILYQIYYSICIDVILIFIWSMNRFKIIFRLNQSFMDFETDFPVHRLNCLSSNLNGSSEHMIY